MLLLVDENRPIPIHPPKPVVPVKEPNNPITDPAELPYNDPSRPSTPKIHPDKIKIPVVFQEDRAHDYIEPHRNKKGVSNVI